MEPTRYSNYYGEHASTYDRFRFDGDDEVTTSISWLLDRFAVRDESTVIEVGAGTARYLSALRREVVGARCIAVDRSIAQLEHVRDLAIRRVCANARRLPFDRATASLVMVVMAIHQFSDDSREEFLAEVARVLIPGSGLLFVKTSSHQDLAARPLVRYFPESVRINQARYPSIDVLTGELERSGLCVNTVEALSTLEVLSVERLIALVRRRGNTTLDLLPESSFREGLEALENELSGCETFELIHRHTYIVASCI